MPRDLEALAGKNASHDLPHLTKSPEALDQGLYDDEEQETTLESILSQRNEKRDEIHPYTQTLSLSDIDSCVLLEEQAFPPNERATREKFQYRLSKCSELSLGVFTSHKEGKIATAETASPVYSGAPERKAVLLGHIVATKSTNPAVTDTDMEIPTSDTPDVGHREEGRTICIHSLAVLPEYQKKGLGKTLMKAYIQRMESHGVADRLALIAHEALIPYYEGFGFQNKGKSKAQFGGGGWFEMVRELRNEEEMEEEEVEIDVLE